MKFAIVCLATLSPARLKWQPKKSKPRSAPADECLVRVLLQPERTTHPADHWDEWVVITLVGRGALSRQRYFLSHKAWLYLLRCCY